MQKVSILPVKCYNELSEVGLFFHIFLDTYYLQFIFVSYNVHHSDTWLTPVNGILWMNITPCALCQPRYNFSIP